MNILERLTSRLTRRPNSIKPGGRNNKIALSYSKPTHEWTPEDRDNWEALVIKEPIEGLGPLKIKETVTTVSEGQDRPSLTEVFKSAQTEVTKSKFK